MNNIKRHILALFAILCIQNVQAQEHSERDSLEKVLANIQAGRMDGDRLLSRPTDTIEATVLFNLARLYADNNPDKAFIYANQCMAISERMDYKKGIGNAYNSLGAVYYARGDYALALKYYQDAYVIRKAIGDKEGLAASYNNFGIVYQNIGNYPEALKNYFTALRMNTASGNKQWKSYNLMNIGTIYSNLMNYTEAIIKYEEALKIAKQINDVVGIGLAYTCIGEAYERQNKDEEALKNLFLCIKICEKSGDKDIVALAYTNIGTVYRKQKKFAESLEMFFKALHIYKEIGAKDGIAELYSFMGMVYTAQNNYKEAKRYLEKGIVLSKEVGKVEMLKTSYEGLTLLATKEGHFSEALEYYKLFIVYRDSLLNQVNTKKITQQQMQFDFDAREAARVSAQEKKDAIDKLIRNGLSVGLFVLLIFAVVFFRQRNHISKGKKKSDELLLNILPPGVAEELKNNGESLAKQFDNVTVIFTDFVNFTGLSEQMTPTELVAEIHHYFTAFDAIIEEFGLEKIKTIGDAYLAVCGLPNETHHHAQRVVKAAIAIQQYMEKNEGRFQIRMGIHSGSVVAGIVGVKKYAYDIWGDTVNTAARMEQHSEAGKINISGATYELVKNDFACEYRGKIQAKNKGEIDMYFVNRSFSEV